MKAHGDFSKDTRLVKIGKVVFETTKNLQIVKKFANSEKWLKNQFHKKIPGLDIWIRNYRTKIDLIENFQKFQVPPPPPPPPRKLQHATFATTLIHAYST